MRCSTTLLKTPWRRLIRAGIYATCFKYCNIYFRFKTFENSWIGDMLKNAWDIINLKYVFWRTFKRIYLCSKIWKLNRHKTMYCSYQAVSIASVISDRVCIHSDTKLQPRISARNLLTCAPSYGCNGGIVNIAWHYWKSNGVVTGGAYGSHVVS